MDSGAEVLVAPSDNASYFTSTLTSWQLASSAMFAIEHGRSLVFIANRGPSVVIDPSSSTVQLAIDTGVSGEKTVEVPQVVGQTIAARGGRAVCTFVLMLVAVVLLLRTTNQCTYSGLQTGIGCSRAFRLCALIGVCALLGTVVGAAASIRLSGRGSAFVEQLSARVNGLVGGNTVFDPSSAVFHQAQAKGCGPAALAWALFGLGDSVYEEQLERRNGSHSLQDLVAAAEQRGFDAVPFQGGPDDLRPVPGRAYVLHMRGDHFVGCVPIDAESFTIFDPESGRQITVNRAPLMEQWSGYGLAIQIRRPTSSTRLSPW